MHLAKCKSTCPARSDMLVVHDVTTHALRDVCEAFAIFARRSFAKKSCIILMNLPKFTSVSILIMHVPEKVATQPPRARQRNPPSCDAGEAAVTWLMRYDAACRLLAKISL